MFKAMLGMLAALFMFSAYAENANRNTLEPDIATLREWKMQDETLFNLLFLGNHSGSLEVNVLNKHQIERIDVWMRQAPTLFAQLYSVAWPDAMKTVDRPKTKERIQTDDLQYISI